MKVEVVGYDPDWPLRFEQEKRLLVKRLGAVAKAVHHIGSTSVEGLAAKPIIDIILEVTSLDALDATKHELEALGYEGMGEFGIVGRRYFRKGKEERTHQIHAFAVGDENIARHLAFRDYLKAHPAAKAEYEALKCRLAKNCNNDIEAYCDGKDSFVKLHEANALKWKADS
ncbi:MAG: GrpB family protein [Pleomorphochaeta sp.]